MGDTGTYTYNLASLALGTIFLGGGTSTCPPACNWGVSGLKEQEAGFSRRTLPPPVHPKFAGPLEFPAVPPVLPAPLPPPVAGAAPEAPVELLPAGRKPRRAVRPGRCVRVSPGTCW